MMFRWIRQIHPVFCRCNRPPTLPVTLCLLLFAGLLPVKSSIWHRLLRPDLPSSHPCDRHVQLEVTVPLVAVFLLKSFPAPIWSQAFPFCERVSWLYVLLHLLPARPVFRFPPAVCVFPPLHRRWSLR